MLRECSLHCCDSPLFISNKKQNRPLRVIAQRAASFLTLDLPI